MGAVGSKQAWPSKKAAVGCSCHVRFKDPLSGLWNHLGEGQACDQLAAESLSYVVAITGIQIKKKKEAFNWCSAGPCWHSAIQAWLTFEEWGEAIGICTHISRIFLFVFLVCIKASKFYSLFFWSTYLLIFIGVEKNKSSYELKRLKLHVWLVWWRTDLRRKTSQIAGRDFACLHHHWPGGKDRKKGRHEEKGSQRFGIYFSGWCVWVWSRSVIIM